MKVKKPKSSKSKSKTRWDLAVAFIVGFFICLSVRLYDEMDYNYVVGYDDDYDDDDDVGHDNDRIDVARMSATTTATATAVSFYEFAKSRGTDKIEGHNTLPKCNADPKDCVHPDHENPRCRCFGHFYDSIYDRWLGPYASPEAEPFQFLEVGFYRGAGFAAYTDFLLGNKGAELHSMEISCLPEGPVSEGKWPWGNFAQKSKDYQALRDADRLHCGDAADYDFLHETWTKSMKRPDAPPLKFVIDDAAHLAHHMATTLFFWFPRIEPGGILVVEDIQPSGEAGAFRDKILPQVMKDMHWCGGTPAKGNDVRKDTLCFPQLQRFLYGVHCEMHICVFQRNSEPAIEPDRENSMVPAKAFDDETVKKCLFGPH